MRWFLIILTGLVLVGGAWWWLAGGEEPPAPHDAASPARPVQAVQVVTVQPRQVSENLQLSGTVAPVRRAVLTTRLSGLITRLAVEEGDAVQAGEVLVRVDSTDVEAQVSQARAGAETASAGARQVEAALGTAQAAVAEAQARIRALEADKTEARSRLALAETEARRHAFLYQEGAIAKQRAEQTQTELEVARARIQGLDAGIRQARAGLQRAQAGLGETRAAVDSSYAAVGQARAGVDVAASQLPYAEVRAPFSGVVTRKSAWQGEMTVPGGALLEIQDVRAVRLEASVPEEQLKHLHPGQSLPVALDALDRKVTGRVDQIVPSGDPASRTFLVKVSLENRDGRIIPGMYGRLEVPQGSRRFLSVPADALVQRGQLEGVMVIEDGDVARLRLVKTGATTPAGTEILTGLKAGERVARQASGLVDGTRVLPQQAEVHRDRDPNSTEEPQR